MYEYLRMLLHTNAEDDQIRFVYEFVSGRARMPASLIRSFSLTRADVVLGLVSFA